MKLYSMTVRNDKAKVVEYGLKNYQQPDQIPKKTAERYAVTGAGTSYKLAAKGFLIILSAGALSFPIFTSHSDGWSCFATGVEKSPSQWQPLVLGDPSAILRYTQDDCF